mgnify:CR=1 FL=1
MAVFGDLYSKFRYRSELTLVVSPEEKNFIVFNLSMLYNNKNDIFIIIHTPPIDALKALCAANQAFFLQHQQGEISTRKLLFVHQHP